MNNVKSLRAVTEADEAWQAILQAACPELMARALAMRPLSVTILMELPDEFKIISFPPGEAAARWIIKTLAQDAINKDCEGE